MSSTALRPGRPGISFEQVAAIWNELQAEDISDPSTREISARLRERRIPHSPNTVQRHVNRLRELGSRASPALPEVSPTVLQELQREIARAVKADRAELEQRLARLQTELDDLAESGEALEQERATSAERVEILTSERDTLRGQNDQQAKDLKHLTDEVERERQAAEAARVREAQARLTAEQHIEELETLRQEKQQLDGRLREEERARVEAQREQAARTAERDGLAERVSDLQARERTGTQEIATVREQLQALTERFREADAQRARAEGEALAAREEITRLGKDLTELRADSSNTRSEYANTVRTAGASQAALERADSQVQELRDSLAQCQVAREQLVRDNERLAEQMRRA
jgi:colicin import membrane protein